MYDLEFIKSVLKDKLPRKRYIHSIGVSETAAWLAEKHKADEKKARIAGVLHDYAKYLTKDEARKYIKQFEIIIDNVTKLNLNLAHGLIGAELVKNDFEIDDKKILDSIRFHTTGRKHMTKLEKIIYLADYIEPNRKFPGIDEIRDTANKDLDKAVLMAIDSSIIHVISRGLLIHNDSILARNDLIEKIDSRRGLVKIEVSKSKV